MAKKKSSKAKGKSKGKSKDRYRQPTSASGASTGARSTKRARAAKPARRSARSQVLPGMEQVRSAKLDNLCEGIRDVRDTMNDAKTEEVGLIASALQVMVQRGITVYKHGGCELARVPGAEKLRVRLTKDQGDAGVDDLEPPSEEEPEVEEESEVETADAGDDAGIH